MPRKQQRGGFDMFGSNEQTEQQTGQQTGQLNQDTPIHEIAKQVAKGTIEIAGNTMLTGVKFGEGTVAGAASQAEQAGTEVGTESVKAAGQITAQSIDTTSTLIISSLQGIEQGGKVFAKEILKHALLASEKLGVAALRTTETVGSAITEKPVQDAVKGAVERTAQAGFLTVEDAALLAAVAAKYGEKALLSILAGASGGGRRHRKTHRRRRHRLKRYSAKHR